MHIWALEIQLKLRIAIQSIWTWVIDYIEIMAILGLTMFEDQ